MVHVPYRRGAPALADLIGGQVQVYFSSTASALDQSAALPDVPAIAEIVPQYEASAWYGLGAPEQAPAEVVSKLNREVSNALADLAFRSRLGQFGGSADHRLSVSGRSPSPCVTWSSNFRPEWETPRLWGDGVLSSKHQKAVRVTHPL